MSTPKPTRLSLLVSSLSFAEYCLFYRAFFAKETYTFYPCWCLLSLCLLHLHAHTHVAFTRTHTGCVYTHTQTISHSSVLSLVLSFHLSFSPSLAVPRRFSCSGSFSHSLTHSRSFFNPLSRSPSPPPRNSLKEKLDVGLFCKRALGLFCKRDL